MVTKKSLFFKLPAFVSLVLSPALFAQNDPEIQKFLNDFHSNPAETMNKIPEKTYRSGKANQHSHFDETKIASKEFLKSKDAFRQKLLQENKPSFGLHAEYLGNDNPKDILDNPSAFVDNINSLDTYKVASARLSFQPWSDSYWPLMKGMITYRYADSNNPDSDNFYDFMNYVLWQQPAAELIRQGRTNALSPAEKYDLLMNDQNFTLTNTILNNLSKKSSFQNWEGICHGWAPAAYLYARPMRSVTVSNASGQPITFYPSDMKALTSLIWANLTPKTRFVGGRCEEVNPATDANGRIISPDCFDTNPGTFHLTLVNQLGIQKHGFAFDASYDYQVWNQPIVSYSYTYFNPETGNTSVKAQNVAINRYDYRRDKFSAYRSQRATFIVGVKTKVTYVVETAPSDNRYDTPRDDALVDVVYYYDLELDSQGTIIGGEWYQNAHPDFLWTPDSTADVSTYLVPQNASYSAFNMYYSYIWNDSPRSPLTAWTPYSVQAAQNWQVPLENVVRNLVSWASVKDSNPAPENCKQPCIPSQYSWHK